MVGSPQVVREVLGHHALLWGPREGDVFVL
jgi:hypothetical protein